MPTPDRKRPLPTWLCMVSPFVLGLTYVTMALHVRFGLGHWPKPMWESYPTLAYRIHEGAFMFVLLFTVCAVHSCSTHRVLRLDDAVRTAGRG